MPRVPFPAAAFVLAAISMTAGSVSAGSLPGGPARVGAPAPAFTLPRAGGGTITLRAYRGKGVYLNFFATWCPPCNEETPDIARIAGRYARRGLVVIGVDEQEDASKALGFIQKYRLVYPVALDDAVIRDAYGALGLPVHIFIDRSQTIKLIRIGAMSSGEIESAITSILR